MPPLKNTTGATAVANSNKIHAEITAYKFTLDAIACLEDIFNNLAGAKLRQGQRMKSGGTASVTPDMVFESAGGPRSSGYRAVCEIKASFPHRPTALDKVVRQIRHYDDDLGGWGTGSAVAGGPRANHDIIIAARIKQAGIFAARLPTALRDRGVKIKRPLSILGIVRRERKDGDLFWAEKLSGTISHAKVDTALAKGVSIDAYRLLKELGNTLFYDSRPPLPYIMSILWIHAFPNLVHDKRLKRLHKDKEILIDVEVDRVHRLVSKYAPRSNPQCVRRSWILASLDEFVGVGLAQKLPESRYKIHYVAGIQRPLGWLVWLVAEGHKSGPRMPGESGEEGGPSGAFTGS